MGKGRKVRRAMGNGNGNGNGNRWAGPGGKWNGMDGWMDGSWVELAMGKELKKEKEGLCGSSGLRVVGCLFP